MFEIIGMKRCDFDTRDGKHISGVKLYLARDLENGSGRETDAVCISDRLLSGESFQLVDCVGILYNKFGRVAGVRIVDDF